MSRLRVAVAAFGFVAVTITTGVVAVAAMPLRAVSPPTPDVASGMNRILRSQPQRAAQAQTATAAPRKQVNRVYPEYPQDALEAGIKGVVVVDITVNTAGDVSTAGVVSGPQALRASAFKAALAMKYTPGPSVTAMQITFEYVLTGTTWGVRIGEALPNIGLRPIPRNADAVAPAPTTNPDATGAYRIGNGLMPPKKIKDVPPAYPAAAQEARVQGVVIMEARVDEQGNVSDVRVLRSIPLLDPAAVDAVKQWQYTPTLLNGVPVPVWMTVTVNFSLRKLFQYEVVQPDGSSGVVGLFANGLLVVPGGRFQLRASEVQDSRDVNLSVFSEDGQTHLGDVTLPFEGPVVQMPTIPSVGLRFLGAR